MVTAVLCNVRILNKLWKSNGTIEVSCLGAIKHDGRTLSGRLVARLKRKSEFKIQ